MDMLTGSKNRTHTTHGVWQTGVLADSRECSRCGRHPVAESRLGADDCFVVAKPAERAIGRATQEWLASDR